MLSWLYFLVLAVGSSVMLTVINILLIRGLRHQSIRRTSMTLSTISRISGKRRSDAHVTRMLVVVICVFLAGEIPSASVSRLLSVDLFDSEHDGGSLFHRTASLVAYTFVVVQHSLNFVIYCLTNTAYSSALRCLFCGEPSIGRPNYRNTSWIVLRL